MRLEKLSPQPSAEQYPESPTSLLKVVLQTHVTGLVAIDLMARPLLTQIDR